MQPHSSTSQDTILKRCSKCGEEKSATKFHRNKTRKDGLSNWCKSCNHAAARVRNEEKRMRREAARPFIAPGFKCCTKCGETKPVACFSRNKGMRDGLCSKCKACDAAYHVANRDRKREYKREYRKKYPERAKETMRKWRERNTEHEAQYIAATAERRAETARRFREKFPEIIRERNREWREKNPERVRARSRQYRERNREKFNAYARNRRARKENAEGEHTGEDVQRQYENQRGRCYYCQEKVGDTYHVDHIVPLSRGGSNGPENIVIACPTCNVSKSTKLPVEWPEGGRLL